MISLDLTLRQWLRQRIQHSLAHKNGPPPFVLWCDPQRVWKELLQKAAAGDAAGGAGFDLWAEDEPELLLRQRFARAERRPRLVWLPVERRAITYFMAFALQAAEVVELSLPEALAQYGVELPAEQWAELAALLPAHARQWCDYPLRHWREHLSPGQVKTALVDDDTFLAALASSGRPLVGLLSAEALPLFNRRAQEDFGLPPLYASTQPAPNPAALDSEAWRLSAVAALLLTEAEALQPNHPTGGGQAVIADPARRDRARKLLNTWKSQVDWMEAFEDLAQRADAQTALPFWARSLPDLPPPLSSPAVENSLFQRESEALARLEEFETLASRLEQGLPAYRQHAEGFWGSRARSRVRWDLLAELAATAALLRQHAQVAQGWKTLFDAVNWFTRSGWQVDQAGEALFRQDSLLPGALVGIRARLRKAYLRHLDRANTAFAGLLASAPALPLPYAGEALGTLLQTPLKQPTALVVLDACRYDVGCRIAEALNRGEPAPRASVSPAQAPLPSITPLGMSFALPGLSAQVQVSLKPGAAQPWLIQVPGFDGNLAEAAGRREWLKRTYKLKDEALLSFKQVLDAAAPDQLIVKALGKLVVVFDDDLDDHDQVLQPFGLEQIIERCAALLRRLRSAGYASVTVVTDHGFFHWEPQDDEKDAPLPGGEVLWKSRRAVVGRDLQHATALRRPVPGARESALECATPRSINAFKTYGGLGFFHGGATLQELVIPVLSVRWPQKGQKIGVVLKPVTQITSLAPRLQVGPQGVQLNFASQMDENLSARPVVVRLLHPQSGKVLFKSRTPQTVEPGGATCTLELLPTPGAQAAAGTQLEIEVRDADDDELLDRGAATLLVELDEWA